MVSTTWCARLLRGLIRCRSGNRLSSMSRIGECLQRTLAWLSDARRPCALVLAGMAFLGGEYAHAQSDQVSADEPVSAQAQQLSNSKLQAALMSFADRFVAQFGQAARELEEQTVDPEMNLRATSAIFTVVPAIEIASQAGAGAALLDMTVFVTLNRLVWAEHWYPLVFKKSNRAPLDALESLELEIWGITKEILTAEQARDLRDLIEEWHKQHPQQHFVNWVRFSDFKSLGQKPSLAQQWCQQSGCY